MVLFPAIDSKFQFWSERQFPWAAHLPLEGAELLVQSLFRGSDPSLPLLDIDTFAQKV